MVICDFFIFFMRVHEVVGGEDTAGRFREILSFSKGGLEGDADGNK